MVGLGESMSSDIYECPQCGMRGWVIKCFTDEDGTYNTKQEVCYFCNGHGFIEVEDVEKEKLDKIMESFSKFIQDPEDKEAALFADLLKNEQFK